MRDWRFSRVITWEVMLVWVVAGGALLLALMAWARAGRLARKLDTVNQSYWELRYDYTRLRSQVARLNPDQADEAAATPAPAAAPTVAFVPLASIKKTAKSSS
jgi:hypothetical protein